MKQLLFIGMLFSGMATYAQSTFGDIIGTLIDGNSEPVWGATVMTYHGETMYREQTDIDGRFRISGIPSGTYTVLFIREGDTIEAQQKAEVVPDGYASLGIVKFEKATDLDVVEILGPPIRLTIGEAPVSTLSQKEIKFSPVKNDMKALVAGMSSEVRQSDDGSLVFRGARKGDLIYYVDGVKLNEVFNLPSSALGHVMVYSGAIPARYGDTNGGVIVVETRSYFDLLREYNNRMSLGN